jgi:WD40 repeat protein
MLCGLYMVWLLIFLSVNHSLCLISVFFLNVALLKSKIAAFCLLHIVLDFIAFYFRFSSILHLLNFRTHSKDITSVTFHRKYPLLASSSEDCTSYVFHGMVYSDLNQNPLIVPLEILRGHASLDGRGMPLNGSNFHLGQGQCLLLASVISVDPAYSRF